MDTVSSLYCILITTCSCQLALLLQVATALLHRRLARGAASYHSSLSLIYKDKQPVLCYYILLMEWNAVLDCYSHTTGLFGFRPQEDKPKLDLSYKSIPSCLSLV